MVTDGDPVSGVNAVGKAGVRGLLSKEGPG